VFCPDGIHGGNGADNGYYATPNESGNVLFPSRYDPKRSRLYPMANNPYRQLALDIIETLRPWLSNEEVETALSALEYNEFYQGARYAMRRAVLIRGAKMPVPLLQRIRNSGWGETVGTKSDKDFVATVIEKATDRELVSA